jgi:hypothetical protein
MDDSSDAFATAVPLAGVSTLAPGKSALFVEVETSETVEQKEAKVKAFENSWFGASLPAGLEVGTYEGSGVGLSSSGDAVNIFNSEGAHLTGVAFGANVGTGSPLTAAETFDNHAGLGSFTSAVPTITEKSVEGQFGARNAHDQIGSPGKTAQPVIPDVKITEVDPTGSSEAYSSDWFELTNMGTEAVNLTNWHASDSANSYAGGGALTGVEILPAGATAVFLEKPAQISAFESAWYPGGVPSGFLIGGYAGAGGLSSGGDQVNVFDAGEEKVTGVTFGAATLGITLDNAAGIGGDETVNPTISTNSVDGTNGAFTNSVGEVGSPGTIANVVIPPPALPEVTITEVDPTGSSATYATDWFELTNAGSTPVDVSGWKMDDSSNAFASAVPLEGVSTIEPGESVLFIETEAGASKVSAFEAAWFGGSVTGLKVGTYHGSGVGLGSGGDQVNVFESDGTKVTGVAFGSATSGVSFDNAHGAPAGGEVDTMLTTASVAGTDGAFKNAAGEIGSPGVIVADPALSATSPVFPSQAVGTVGPGQWVTVTNTGIGQAQILDVGIEESNRESAGDFLLAGDHCSGATLNPGQSCEVLIRFSPSRENATSSAQLVIASDAVDSPLTVALTGTSTGLPEGPKGDTGNTGATGATGAPGATGPTGPKGDTGAAGPKGDKGDTGPAGPRGATGPAGKNGKNGKNGKDGVVSFTTSEGNAEARRGGTAHLQFKLKNGTVGTLSGAKLRADSLSGNGSSTVRVPTLRAHETRKLTLDLKVGKNTSLGRHKVRVELSVGGHTLTQTAIVVVSR